MIGQTPLTHTIICVFLYRLLIDRWNEMIGIVLIVINPRFKPNIVHPILFPSLLHLQAGVHLVYHQELKNNKWSSLLIPFSISQYFVPLPLSSFANAVLLIYFLCCTITEMISLSTHFQWFLCVFII